MAKFPQDNFERKIICTIPSTARAHTVRPVRSKLMMYSQKLGCLASCTFGTQSWLLIIERYRHCGQTAKNIDADQGKVSQILVFDNAEVKLILISTNRSYNFTTISSIDGIHVYLVTLRTCASSRQSWLLRDLRVHNNNPIILNAYNVRAKNTSW